MKFATILAIALAVFACVVSAAQFKDEFEHVASKAYVLSLQKCDASSPWTLHGLWPEWGMNCPGELFNEAKVAPIRSALDKDWLSCPGHQGNVAFWAHEWEKHGRCDNYTQLEYFQVGLDLLAKFKSKCAAKNGECRFCLDKNLNPC